MLAQNNLEYFEEYIKNNSNYKKKCFCCGGVGGGGGELWNPDLILQRTILKFSKDPSN